MKFSAITTLLGICIAFSTYAESSDHLIILHTNDTHSQLDPDTRNRGGILRRKVVVDSIRATHPDVLLVDAGDFVQGSLYYSLFRGVVETEMMNALGYDIQITGNHEFDNGIDSLAAMAHRLNASLISTNYDFSGTPLEGLFTPWAVRRFGDKTVGFIGINLLPDGMISEKQRTGVKYLDGLEMANRTAAMLRTDKQADYVVAISHIGYSGQKPYSDIDIAAHSSDIDIIIGGHSHTLLSPSGHGLKTRVANLRGDTVLIAQAGARGTQIGMIDLDLGSGQAVSSVIDIDSRLDNRIDPAAASILDRYRSAVDSISSIRIGTAGADLMRDNWGLVNLVADFVADAGGELCGRTVDLAIMNRGGIRCDIDSGAITQGLIMTMVPFDNHIEVMELKGSDLIDLLNVMASRGGNGVSASVHAGFDPSTGRCTDISVGGMPVDNNRTYIVATLDYLADGGDYMTPLKHGHRFARSEYMLFEDMIRHFVNGPLGTAHILPDTNRRMSPRQTL